MSALDTSEVKLIIAISERLAALEIMVGNLRLQIDRVDKDVQTMISACGIDEKDNRQADKELLKRITALEKREMKYLGIFTGISITIGATIGGIWALFNHKILAFFK